MYPAVLEDMDKWERALKDPQVWNRLLNKGSPSDLLAHLYFLNREWESAVRQTKTSHGNRDAMKQLLNYIVQSEDPRWPKMLCEGLEECGQKVIGNLFVEKYTEICRRPVFEGDGLDGPDGELCNIPRGTTQI